MYTVRDLRLAMEKMGVDPAMIEEIALNAQQVVDHQVSITKKTVQQGMLHRVNSEVAEAKREAKVIEEYTKKRELEREAEHKKLLTEVRREAEEAYRERDVYMARLERLENEYRVRFESGHIKNLLEGKLRYKAEADVKEMVRLYLGGASAGKIADIINKSLDEGKKITRQTVRNRLMGIGLWNNRANWANTERKPIEKDYMRRHNLKMNDLIGK